jgi:hypothetical protein
LLATVGRSHTYEKKVKFTSAKDIISELNSKPLAAFKDESKRKYNIVYSDIFNECLSKRKRITSPGITYSRLNVTINKERDNEENKKLIIENYLSRGKNIECFNTPDKIEAYNLIGTCEDLYDKKNDKVNMDVVLIDEGEGWVIDYFNINPQGDQNDSNKHK